MGSLKLQVRVGDLVKVDYLGWTVPYDLREKEYHGIIVDLLNKGGRKCLTLLTTDGEEKFFSCNDDEPPNVTILEKGVPR